MWECVLFPFWACHHRLSPEHPDTVFFPFESCWQFLESLKRLTCHQHSCLAQFNHHILYSVTTSISSEPPNLSHNTAGMWWCNRPGKQESPNWCRTWCKMFTTLLVWFTLYCCFTMLQHVTACYSMLQHVTACYSMLQHVAACCSMLQHVTACYSMLQHVTACFTMSHNMVECQYSYLILNGAHQGTSPGFKHRNVFRVWALFYSAGFWPHCCVLVRQ